jgi:hypothetical protein
MPWFTCGACGRSYYSPDNFTICPFCMGLGKPNGECICVNYCAAFSGIRLNLVKEKNSQCPVHGVANK